MKKNLTLGIFFLIVLTDVGDGLAQLLMKKGVVDTNLELGSFSHLITFIFQNITSPLLWLGILLYALTFFIWIIVLCQIDLSVALPVGSTSYLLIPIIAILFLHESVSPLRWLGTLSVILGIHFVSKSAQQTTRSLPPLEQ